ncbi:MAG TPA: hypothetical protein PKN33_03100 [Phycisphaerae bacterium]|nr:hypothetical protein [Phycisphaerae bacterium]
MNLEEINDLVGYAGVNPEMRMWICQTLNRLPDDVARYAAEHCLFLSVGDVAGITIPNRHSALYDVDRWENDRDSRRWIIVLSDQVESDEAHCLIAHEIGHAWRGDDCFGPPSDDDEVETAKLVKSWGFEGRWADPDFCDAPRRESLRVEEGGE